MSHYPPTRSNAAPASLSGNQTPVATGSTTPMSSRNRETSIAVVTKEVLSQALGVRRDLLRQDLRTCLRSFGTLDESEQDLVKFLIKQPKFQDWLRAPTSQILLINANADGVEAISPITCLSARLLRDLGNITPILTLHFFCSRSIRSVQNITDDAAGMLKFIISQLSDFVPDLAFLDRRLIGAIEDGTDVGVLFNIFEKMLLQLPSKTYVYCVIDNISLYENPDQRDDFLQVIRRLRTLTMDESEKLIIKVLFTCHGQSRLVGYCLDDKEKLSGYGAFQEDGQGLSENAWNCIMERSLEELKSAA